MRYTGDFFLRCAAESPVAANQKGGGIQLFTHKFGIEVEFTGITREKAAGAAAEYLRGSARYSGGYYEAYEVTAPDGRVWKFMYDGSIRCQKKKSRRIVGADSSYSVEMVSPILSYYEDIGSIQSLIRRLRKAGGFTNNTCGIHILRRECYPL